MKYTLLALQCSSVILLAAAGGISGGSSGGGGINGGGSVSDPLTLGTLNVTNSLVIGSGGSTNAITTTNGYPYDNGMPFMLLNEYLDNNTNQIWLTGTYAATYVTNSPYSWWAAGNVYTNAASTVRIITNQTDTAITNFFPGITNYWIVRSTLGGGVAQLVQTNLNTFLRQPWYTTSGVLTNIVSVYSTNAFYRFEVYDSMLTNYPNPALTNGRSIRGTSNGTSFIFTSRVGATNTAATKVADAP